jgi:hypothetical protein
LIDDDQHNILSEITKAIPLLPVIGFIFAMSYEQGFFIALGMRASLILEISDIVKASVLFIAPAIPAALIGICLGYYGKIDGGQTSRTKAKAFFYNAPRNIIVVTAWMGAIAFILLGASPKLGSLFALAIFAQLLLRLILNDFTRTGLKPEILMIIYVVTYSSAACAGMGMVAANNVRSANISSFPQTGEKFFVRSLANGHLLLSQDLTRLEFETKSPERTIEFEIEREPFQGILCYAFDWCWANGWNNQKLR